MKAKDLDVGMVVAVRQTRRGTARRAIVLDPEPLFEQRSWTGAVRKRSPMDTRGRRFGVLCAVEGTGYEDVDEPMEWFAKAIWPQHVVSTWEAELVRQANAAAERAAFRARYEEQQAIRRETNEAEAMLRRARADAVHREKEQRKAELADHVDGFVEYDYHGGATVTLAVDAFRDLVSKARS